MDRKLLNDAVPGAAIWRHMLKSQWTRMRVKFTDDKYAQNFDLKV
jgi:hypothetical protein